MKPAGKADVVLDRLPEGARVLIVRLRSLGDCVLTTPAISLLHRYRPDLRISVMAEPAFEAVYRGNPAIRSILTPSARAAFMQRPKLVVNLHGGTRSIGITAASLARWRAGFGHYRAPWLYNVRIPRAQEILGVERRVHTAEHVASAMFWLGVPRQEIPRAQLFASVPATRTGYAVLHPFAATQAKTWPAERFVKLARHIQNELRLEAVFIGAAGDDWQPLAGFRTLQGASLDGVKNLLSGASLFVGNDSGPAHMAAAFGVPVAVIFGPSDSTVWAPWQTASQVLRGGSAAENVPLDDVAEAVSALCIPGQSAPQAAQRESRAV
jgi:ADP-heptose:LPS heptosyltransferase